MSNSILVLAVMFLSAVMGCLLGMEHVGTRITDDCHNTEKFQYQDKNYVCKGVGNE